MTARTTHTTESMVNMIFTNFLVFSAIYVQAITLVDERLLKFNFSENSFEKNVSLFKFDTDEDASFLFSLETCENRNQQLSAFSSQPEYNALVDMFDSNQEDLFAEGNALFSAYLGGTHVLGTNVTQLVEAPQTTDFVFLDETIEDLSVLHDVSNWRDDEPNNFNGEEGCLAMSGQRSVNVVPTNLNDFFCVTKSSEELNNVEIGFFCTDVVLDVAEQDEELRVVKRKRLKNFYFGGMLSCSTLFMLCLFFLVKTKFALRENEKLRHLIMYV